MSSRHKKTFLLDQKLLDQARRLLGARTETETVTAALQLLVRRELQSAGVRELARLGPVDASRIE